MQAEILPSEPDLVNTSVGKSKMTSMCASARILQPFLTCNYTLNLKRNGTKNQPTSKTIQC